MGHEEMKGWGAGAPGKEIAPPPHGTWFRRLRMWVCRLSFEDGEGERHMSLDSVSIAHKIHSSHPHLSSHYSEIHNQVQRGTFSWLQVTTVRVDSLPHRKWKKVKQQPSMLPGSAVSGCCLVSFRFLCNINSIHSVQTYDKAGLNLELVMQISNSHSKSNPLLLSPKASA